MPQAPRLLIVGAQPGSLGDLVRVYAEESGLYGEVVTAGVSGQETFGCDLTRYEEVHATLVRARPDHVVCTAGVNLPTSMTDEDLAERMMVSFDTNVVGPMELLRQFTEMAWDVERPLRLYVAISSNSASIARTASLPYCASKAALSMALRVAARELAARDNAPLVWGYEPGLLAGTPMTEATKKQFPNVPLHRMKGVPAEGIDSEVLARRILFDLANADRMMHGVLFRLDAGEQ